MSTTTTRPAKLTAITARIGPLVRATGDVAGSVSALVRHSHSGTVYRAIHADLAEVAARALQMMDAIDPNVQYNRDLVEAKCAELS